VRNLKNLIVILGLLTSVGAWAGTEAKIAVVDIGKAIFATEVAKTRIDQLKANSDYAGLQAKYDSTTADLQALSKDAEGKSMTWSRDQMAEYQKKVEYLRADLQLTAQKLDSEIKSLQNGILQELQPKALESLKELVEEEKITLLLRADAVLVADPGLNLTAKLMERRNKKTKTK